MCVCVVGLVLRCSSHVIYLIEGKLSLSEHDRKLRSAIVSTQLEPNFRTKQTADLLDTVRFLARMTRHVEGSLARNIQAASPRSEYINAQLYRLCSAGTYAQFAVRAAKTSQLTVRVPCVFYRWLRGISASSVVGSR